MARLTKPRGTASGPRAPEADYAELHARSAFSMLDGASTPEQLVRRAAEIGLPALALTDLNDLGGAIRFAEACRDHDVRPIFGGEVSLAPGGSVVLLCENAGGWQNLSHLITHGRMHHERGLPAVDLDVLAAHAGGLVCTSGGREGAVDVAEAERGATAARQLTGTLAEIFRERFYIEVQDHDLPEDVHRIDARLRLARALDLPWVTAGDVRHATAAGKPIHDVLRCLERRIPLDEAGDRLFPNDARRLISPAEARQRWHAAPAGRLRTLEVAERCQFHVLRDLRPTLPRFPLPEGLTDADAYLEQLVREGMRSRYPRPTEKHRRQIRHELDVIRRLGLAGYFLIVHDIARFARHRGVLTQGRGSAANSAVCYCLGITAVDPIGLDLLFERFLSEGRGEPPDIDLDFAHRDREEVLQYVYDRYGRDHAAMVCEVITWRGRSAVRDAARVLGLPAEVGDRLAGQVGPGVPTDARATGATTAADLLLQGGFERTGLDPNDGRMRALVRILRGLEGLPRHRSIHVGGFVLTGEPLAEVVPIEPAAMEGRTVVQWDKDDLEPVGLVKFDLLGLGMLTLLSDALALVKQHRGETLDLAALPPDDPATYEMMQRADTVGLFQIESRAQMSSLPRNRPERFYDLVVQVALIRPGPIQGEMVHPYLRRRRGEEPVSYLHPILKPVLERTLGVPLFQEQGMKVAVTAAGFTANQADELRRAVSSKRMKNRMARLELELLQGMERNHIPRKVAERIVKQLSAFASYGFPESHAASFALLVYASAYLKRHYAPEFYAAILNAQPMGFYPVGTLVSDARRHGVEVRPPDVVHSDWLCTLERSPSPAHPFAVRLGLRMIKGLGARAHEGIERARRARAFASIEAFAHASALPKQSLVALAEAGALDGLDGTDRRRSLWEVLRIARPKAGPLDIRPGDPAPAPLPDMAEAQAVVADYVSTGASAERHPMEFLRARCAAEGIPPLGDLARFPEGPVRVAGLVNSRQRPATARGFVFLSLEDETGMINIVVPPPLFARRRDVILAHSMLVVWGHLERRQGASNVRAERIEPVPATFRAPSHDFH
ncbi:MAG: DNA polymerase III subunit alpha [Myxococcota bacterium]